MINLEDVSVLIADDDTAALDVMSFMAASKGWTFTCVTSAHAMIEAVNENCTDANSRCFDCIIADVNYAGETDEAALTGIGAAKQIRKLRPNVPIIFISGWVNSLIREEARRVRAELVQKPNDPDVLFDIATDLIIKYRELKQSGGPMFEATQKDMIAVPERVENIIREVRASQGSK